MMYVADHYAEWRHHDGEPICYTGGSAALVFAGLTEQETTAAIAVLILFTQVIICD